MHLGLPGRRLHQARLNGAPGIAPARDATRRAGARAAWGGPALARGRWGTRPRAEPRDHPPSASDLLLNDELNMILPNVTVTPAAAKFIRRMVRFSEHPTSRIVAMSFCEPRS